jgi:hypothetical protein
MTTRSYRAVLVKPDLYRLKIIANNVVLIEAEVNAKALDSLKSLCLQWVHEGLTITDIDEAFKNFFQARKES